MSHTLQSLPSYKLTAVSTVFTKIKALFTALDKFMVTRARQRRTLKELNSLTNRELNDIGITRGDIKSIAYGNFYADSSRTMPLDANKNKKGWV
jgi:uncharacterized protein YjiS (DUF1127 family)